MADTAPVSVAVHCQLLASLLRGELDDDLVDGISVPIHPLRSEDDDSSGHCHVHPNVVLDLKDKHEQEIKNSNERSQQEGEGCEESPYASSVRCMAGCRYEPEEQA